MKRVLITGAPGFSGKHLLQRLSQDSSLEVFCTGRKEESADRFLRADLTCYSDAESILKTIQPDQIYHLAGSFTNDYLIDYNNNVLSTKNILDCVLKLNIHCRVLLVGSAAEYGMVSSHDNPVSENHPLKPVSIYGLTKVYQTYLMQYYCSTHQMDIVMARTFNLLGKKMSKVLFMGSIYEKINHYKKGKISKISVGPLNAERDYIEVVQAVQYYHLIMDYGLTGGVYNVGSGKPIKMSELLFKILKENGLSEEDIEEKETKTQNVLQIYANIQKLTGLIKS